MTTVKQYLEQLPEPARSRALENLFHEYADEWSTSLPAALKRAFLWHRSPEKYEYWKQVHKETSE